MYAVTLSLLIGVGWQPQPVSSSAPNIKRVPIASDAVSLALEDVRRIPEVDRLFTRYIWVRNGSVLNAKVVSFTFNTVSRSTIVQRPVPIVRGPLMLLRFDLRSYAPRIEDLKEWIKLWDVFQFDPRLNLLITKGTLKSVDQSVLKGTAWISATQNVFIDTEPYVENGERLHGRWESKKVQGLREIDVKDLKDIDLIRIPGQFLDRKQYIELSSALGTVAPVVSDDYFVSRMLSAIQDKGVYQIVYGGLYYQFSGIKRNFTKGTDEDNLLEQLGVGNVAKNVTAKEIFSKIRSDQRAAIFRSTVTGKPRQIEFFRTLTGRLDMGTGLISFTHDLKDQDFDIDVHPIGNLLNFKDAAREVIFEKSNGLHGYVAFNGQGALQDEVPFDVANDHTIPSPFTMRLQPAISCISCHEADGSDGWKPVTNDVLKLVKSKGKIDIFGDTTQERDTIPDTLDRLAGLYQGDPERALARGRDDYAAGVLKATGPWPASVKGQADVVKLTAEKTVAIWRRYYYDTINADQALIELGVNVSSPAESSKIFDELLKPDVRATTQVLGVGSIIPEDPRIAALKAGVSISRFDFDLVYSFLADRVQQSLAKLLKGAKK